MGTHTPIMNTVLDELKGRAEIRERRRREERTADKKVSRYSHTWGESLHVVTVTFFKCVNT